jgi:hypothetical protein
MLLGLKSYFSSLLLTASQLKPMSRLVTKKEQVPVPTPHCTARCWKGQRGDAFSAPLKISLIKRGLRLHYYKKQHTENGIFIADPRNKND